MVINNVCIDCKNNGICLTPFKSSCEHFNITFSDSEIIDIANDPDKGISDKGLRGIILSAIENLYSIKITI